MDFRKGRGREELEINLIPFIDVLLVILIFMMVTTTYSKFSSLHIKLPTEDDGDRSKEQIVRIHVAVDAQGHYAINDQVITATDAPGLEAELKRVADEKAQKDPNIVIDADALATHQSVMNVMEAASRLGFDNMTFSIESGAKK